MSITLAAASTYQSIISCKRTILLNILLNTERRLFAFPQSDNGICNNGVFPLRKTLQLRTFSVAPPDS